jgi:dipeptide/tripeptide permease
MVDNSEWTHIEVFTASYLAAALCGLSSYLWSNEPFTARGVFKSFFYSGCAGCTLSMLLFDTLGGKEKWWRVVGTSAATGMGYITGKDIVSAIPRVISVLTTTTTPPKQNDPDKTADKNNQS